MQFSLIVLLAIAATAVSAAPAKNTCNLKTCVVDLAPTVAACASAAAQDGIDPVSDEACITAAAKTLSKLPAPCTGCAKKLGVSSAVDSAKNAIESLF
ncbi:hypothetical protein B0H19DRAFT_1250397 [Mycena capillaripes]|nr:hypothetical protein B0H19DRAFT_1250397 [Mycena capillaripes]